MAFNSDQLLGLEMLGGGANANVQQGGSEFVLTPFILSMILLGMKVASDPKLDFVYKKHKMSGGNVSETLQTMMNTMQQSAGGSRKKATQRVKKETKPVKKTIKHHKP